VIKVWLFFGVNSSSWFSYALSRIVSLRRNIWYWISYSSFWTYFKPRYPDISFYDQGRFAWFAVDTWHRCVQKTFTIVVSAYPHNHSWDIGSQKSSTCVSKENLTTVYDVGLLWRTDLKMNESCRACTAYKEISCLNIPIFRFALMGNFF
jgi:hypothetical protein